MRERMEREGSLGHMTHVFFRGAASGWDEGDCCQFEIDGKGHLRGVVELDVMGANGGVWKWQDVEMESLNSRVEGEHEKRGIVQGGERQRKKGCTEQQRENSGVS